MTELDLILSSICTHLNSNSSCAVTAFGTEPIDNYDEPVVAVSIFKASAENAGHGEYLGLYTDIAHGDRELYGKKLALELGLYVYVPRTLGANECNTVFSDMTAILALPSSPVKADKITMAEPAFDKTSGMFLAKAKAECSAFLTYEMTDSGQYTDFKLGGRLV